MGIKRGIRRSGMVEAIKIKMGMKGDKYVKNGVERRKSLKLDYFRICNTFRGPDGNYQLIEDLHSPEKYGPKPTSLTCTVPFDDIDKVFPTEFRVIQNGKIICFGDGIKAMRTDGNGKQSEVPCNPDECPYLTTEGHKGCKCKPFGRLHVILSELQTIGTIAVLKSYGWNTVSNILGFLEHLKERTGGILRGIPMRLRLLKKDHEKGAFPHAALETVMSDWDEVFKASLLEIEGRKKYDFDMKLIEDKYSQVINDKGNPSEDFDEFYDDGIQTLVRDGNGDTKAAIILGAEQLQKKEESQKKEEEPKPEITVEAKVAPPDEKTEKQAAIKKETVKVQKKETPEEKEKRLDAAEKMLAEKIAARDAERAEIAKLKKENDDWAEEQKKKSDSNSDDTEESRADLANQVLDTDSF